ncbi:hypothetical protein LAZ67_3005704 [Cordylochernes scorpioides]|uniref:Uncharacterized protein n=1 Tax=Cordylochernes scorpioides TaxID=51811 RepID=A0ABY6KAQ9_9ARAC|nr:hypothetical protein LAZ67_3005704 [Cordylochernes scorpioides]
MTRTDSEWKDKIITGDETWVYGYDPDIKQEYLEEDPEDDSTNFQEEDIPTERTQQPKTREEISGPITRSRALRLRIVAKATIYKYILFLCWATPAITSTCPLCAKELPQSIGGDIFTAEGVGGMRSPRPRLSHTFSMGFRSGDRAGQFIQAIAWFWRKVSTTPALCGRALSSIRRKFSPISNALGITYAAKISSLYLCPVRVPFRKIWSALRPPKKIPAQTIKPWLL